MEASAKDGEGAGRGPCGLRNSELGPRPHDVLFAFKKDFIQFLSAIKRTAPWTTVVEVTMRSIGSECVSFVDVHDPQSHLVTWLVFERNIWNQYAYVPLFHIFSCNTVPEMDARIEWHP